jgi:glutaminyl-tRNA synthetase
MSEPGNAAERKGANFIEQAILDDLAAGKNDGRLCFRFPPEPNGFLHIGHAKAICLNFGLSQKFNAPVNLRLDDTNPAKEDVKYVEAIKRDINWLGFEWSAELYASDYFEELYDMACRLIKKGKAFVCEVSPEEMSRCRGSTTEPGINSPYRDRSVEENLDLFARMRAGEFPDGSRTLRAKIDMAHPNFNMRDPVMYRIQRMHHYRTGDAWVIYPTYDYAHGQSDSIEKISHSLCSLEFEHHRPLYEWYIRELGIFPSRQIEFARLNLTSTVMSKRYLLKLVESKSVSGWDDPRMPTLSGMRRRGYTPEAIRSFCESIGITKFNAVHDYSVLERHVRDDLNKRCGRVMAVLEPLKLVIENLSESRDIEAPNNPEDLSAGSRMIPFGPELWIEREDFEVEPPPGYFRLYPGAKVRLRHAGIVECTGFTSDESGGVTAVRARLVDEDKAKGTIHWVAAHSALPIEVRLFEPLLDESADPELDFMERLNPSSRRAIKAWLEPSLAEAKAGDRWQFERNGYFSVDPDSRPGALVFNRTVTLKEGFKKAPESNAKPKGPSKKPEAKPTKEKSSEKRPRSSGPKESPMDVAKRLAQSGFTAADFGREVPAIGEQGAPHFLARLVQDGSLVTRDESGILTYFGVGRFGSGA